VSSKSWAKLPRAGERYEHKGITVRLVEVIRYQSPSKRRMLMVAYRIIDGDYNSPVAHFWMPARDDIRVHIERVVDNYLTIKASIRR